MAAAAAATVVPSFASTAIAISASGIDAAQATHLAMEGIELAVAVLGNDENAVHQASPFCLSAATSSAASLTITPFCRCGGASILQHLEERRRIDAERRELDYVERLLLRLHDVGKLDVARLVEPEIGRADAGQIHLDRFETGVDFARHARNVALEFDFRGKSRLRAIPECREHLAGLAAVVVDRLLAEDDETRGLSRSTSFSSTRATAGGSIDGVRLDEDGAVGTHRERIAQLLLGLLRSDAGGDDFIGFAALAQAQRLLERDRVERIGAQSSRRRSRRRCRRDAPARARCSR